VRPATPSGPPPSRGVRRLLLTAVVAGALAVVAGGPVGTLALVVGMAALATAAGFAMRAQWVAAGVEELPPPAPAAPAADLRQLRAEHITRVDAALDEGRHDLARALVDAHQEQVRRLSEGAAQPS
jgi:hypothetical protein